MVPQKSDEVDPTTFPVDPWLKTPNPLRWRFTALLTAVQRLWTSSRLRHRYSRWTSTGLGK